MNEHFELVNEPVSWEQVGGDGHIHVYANVRGYWARDVITLRIRRNGWAGDEKAKWTAHITHSTGGRDTDVEPSDAVAVRSFAAALVAMAYIAEERVAMHAAQWEANYQARLEAYRVAAAQERAEQEARVEADAALGDIEAAGLMAKAAAQAKAYGGSAEIQMCARGEDGGWRVTVWNRGRSIWRIEDEIVSAEKVQRRLSASSHRTRLVESEMA
jgi:hypothetical protein